MKIKKFENLIQEKVSNQEMMYIYDKYGIDIHSVPSSLQSGLNSLIRDFIKLRYKKSNKIIESNENENLSIFDYNNESDDGLVVKIEFTGKEETKLSSIKQSDCYCENYSPGMTATDIDNLIHYSIEQWIYENGIGGYSHELVDKEGEKVDIGLYMDSEKYNL